MDTGQDIQDIIKEWFIVKLLNCIDIDIEKEPHWGGSDPFWETIIDISDCYGNNKGHCKFLALAGYGRNLIDEVETTHIMEAECNKTIF